MRIDDLFVKDPIKKVEPVQDMEIEGSFMCQNCDEESDVAKIREGKIWWVCSECNFKSVVNGFG